MGHILLGWLRRYLFLPFKEEARNGHSLRCFILDNGAPAELVTDYVKEEDGQTGWSQ